MLAKVWIHRLDKTAPLYTSAMLRALISHFGVTLATTPDDADAVWVSICDTDSLGVIKEAKAIAGLRPLIMGGFESFMGEPWLAWADYIVVGEGADFIEEWARDWKSAVQMPCILTRTKAAEANYNVRYDLAPLARSGKRKGLYLAGRGCKGKCRFCITGWAQPYTTNTTARIKQAAIQAADAGMQLSLVSNDSPFMAMKTANAQSVRVRDYLANPSEHKAKMLHFGIEGWTEEHRMAIGKPISDALLQELESVTSRHKQVCEWFFIADYPGWQFDDVERFASAVLPLSLGGSRLIVSVTYFDPVPHTPWASEPVAGRYCDSKLLFQSLNSRNKRIVTSPPRSRADSAWRTCFHRATPPEAFKLGPRPNVANTPQAFAAFADRLASIGLDHLLDRQTKAPCGRISVTYRAAENTRVYEPVLTGMKCVQPGIIGYQRKDIESQNAKRDSDEIDGMDVPSVRK